MQVKFGSQLAANPSPNSSTQIQLAAPPSAVNGAVNLIAYFPNSWLALAPDAFSYGPRILQVLPNAGASSGSDSVQIYGYGFGMDPTEISVKIGGTSSTVAEARARRFSSGVFPASPIPARLVLHQPAFRPFLWG